MTSVENRLAKLEVVLKNLLPDVDIEDVLSSPSLLSHPTQITSSDSYAAANANGIVDNVSGDELSENLPQEADGFDWKEEATDVHALSDGMAALSVEPSGIGYLGTY